MLQKFKKTAGDGSATPLKKKKSVFRMSDSAFYACIAFVLGAMFMYFVYLLRQQTIAGGENTVMRMDLYHQYGPLYAELYDRLTQGKSLLYSWNSGMGSSFLGNLLNYCCSPFTLIMLLFRHVNIPEAIAIIMLLKGASASATFTYYINRSFGARKSSIAFGLLYAFSGYYVAYSWNVMWMDAFLMFPLVMLGIRFIIDRGKPGLYVFALTYVMFTNYYMAYMVCILSVLYFLYFYFCRYKLTEKLSVTQKKEPAAGETDTETSGGFLDEIRNSRFISAGVRFAFGSILAAMIAAMALLPVFYILQSSSATSSNDLPSFASWKEYFNTFDFLANHLADLDPTIRSSGEDVLPNIYCGVMTLLLIPLYLFNGNISKRKRVLSCVFLVVFYTGFALNFFNYIWHGMHYPNDLPYRYSFAYSFLLLGFAYEAFLRLREVPKKYILGSGIGIMGFIVLLTELGSKNIRSYSLIINIGFTAVYVLLLCMISMKKFRRDVVAILLCCAVLSELVIADSTNFVMTQTKEAYCGDYESFRDIADKTHEYEREQGDNELFYREERSKLLTRMDASWMDYNGISIFSSMAYESTSAFMRQLGLFGNGINSYTYNPQTAVFNTMFGLKYIYDKDNLLQDGTLYTKAEENDMFRSFRYNYELPVAFAVNEDLRYWTDSGSTNPFINQNNLFSIASDSDEPLKTITAEPTVVTNSDLTVDDTDIIYGSFKFTASQTADGKATVKYVVPEDGSTAIYFKCPDCKAYSLKADNGFSTAVYYGSGSTTYYSADVGDLKAGQTMSLELTFEGNGSDGKVEVYAVQLDFEKFTAAYEKLKEYGTLDITEFNESSFTGTIRVANDSSILYTSIPYDKSWNVFVDGQQIVPDELIALADSLLAVPIGPGEHSVTFTYQARGLKAGLSITLIGLLLLAAWALLHFINKKRFARGKAFPTFFFDANRDLTVLIEDSDDNYLPEPADDGIPGKEDTSSLLNIILCYLTFGLYYFFWKASLYTRIKAFASKYAPDWKCSSKFAMLFLPFFGPGWISDASKMLSDTAAKYGIAVKADAKWRMFLGCVAGGFYAMADLQDDFNFILKNIERAIGETQEEAARQAAERAARQTIADAFEDIPFHMHDFIESTEAETAADTVTAFEEAENTFAEAAAAPAETDAASGETESTSAETETDTAPAETDTASGEAEEAAPEEPFVPTVRHRFVKPGFMKAVSIILTFAIAVMYFIGLKLTYQWMVDFVEEDETTTAESAPVITLPPVTGSDAETGETETDAETTAETTTEAPTEAETTTAFDASLLGNAARSLLQFSGIELDDENGLILFISATSRSGDTLRDVCTRSGVDFDRFEEMILVLNDKNSGSDPLGADTKLILPVLVEGEEKTETADEIVG